MAKNLRKGVSHIPVAGLCKGIVGYSMQSLVQSTKKTVRHFVRVYVYNGVDKNSFTYYEDDGKSLDYSKGIFCRRNIVFDPGTKKIALQQQEGSYTSQFRHIQFILHGFDDAMNNISAGNHPCNYCLTQRQGS